MKREDMIEAKNSAVRQILRELEESNLDPTTYNKLRNSIRFRFNFFLNQMFNYLRLDQVPLKREGTDSGHGHNA